MRWPIVILLGLLLAIVQASLVGLIAIGVRGVGPVWPDLLAAGAVFAALRARTVVDAMLVGWIMGMCVDLFAGGGPGASVVIGPMALSYTLMSYITFRMRGVFYGENFITRMIVSFMFCFLAHSMWVVVQSVLAYAPANRATPGELALHVLLTALYTAAVAPILVSALVRVERIVITSPASQRNR